MCQSVRCILPDTALGGQDLQIRHINCLPVESAKVFAFRNVVYGSMVSCGRQAKYAYWDASVRNSARLTSSAGMLWALQTSRIMRVLPDSKAAATSSHGA